ncbi:MAG: hypothetical protein P1V97_11980 [Planctomycetota bacterium]|nr:hypothetical protein [Planctomycetota bacterium]
MPSPAPNQPLSHYQSAEFYHGLIGDPTQFTALSNDAKQSFFLGLRDLYFQYSEATLSEETKTLFHQVIDICLDPPNLEEAGLSFTFCPSKRFKALRFIDEKHIPRDWRPLFKHSSKQCPEFVAAFVDPEEFHFRSFENILPLDKLFDKANPSLSLSNFIEHKSSPKILSLKVDLHSELKTRLQSLDSLDLYTKPLNSQSRGGQRLIFHSAFLSECLSQAISKTLPQSFLEGFSHINPVFRCNRFDPGDKDFLGHYDTPYHDPSRNHISRYTAILYLTGGDAPGLLSFEDLTFDSMEPFTLVLFDQSQKHQATAYLKGRKVFLRTELIFEDKSLKQEPKIGHLFSKACYLEGERAFHSELSAMSHHAFDQVALAHWTEAGGLVKNPDEALIHKSFRGCDFLANGYDFWFPKGRLPLKELAALTLLDYFNCKLKGVAFRKLCQSRVIKEPSSLPWIARFLAGYRDLQPERLFFNIDKDNLFPVPNPTSHQSCCPGHRNPETFDPFSCDDVLDLFRRAQNFSKKRVEPAAVLFLGQELLLDPERFIVKHDKIYVLSDKKLAPVNFASCWQCSMEPPDYIDVDLSIEALHFNLPPILYREFDGYYHLMFDFFRNSWMVDQSQQTIPIPKITTKAWDSDAAKLWLDEVDPAIVKTELKTTRKRENYPFWAYPQTPLVKELYDTTEDSP